MTANHSRPDESGIVLILLMLVVVLVGTASLSIASTSRDTFAATRSDTAQAEAQAAVDGALATARHRLRSDPGWRGSIETLGSHRIETSVDPVGDGYRITLLATGTTTGAHRRAAVAELGAPPRTGGLPTVRGYATSTRHP